MTGKWKPGLLAIFITLITGYAIARLVENPLPSPPQQHVPPQQVVDRFLKAVDRGELTLFIYTLNRAILIPRRVEYVYDLDKQTPTVSVYCDLKEGVPVPGQPGMEVRAVTSELDYSGQIVETRAHVFATDDQDDQNQP